MEDITTWLTFPSTISCKCIHMESHDWWALIRFGLKETRTGVGTCFFCTVPLEDCTHKFIKCPIACTIWKYLLNIWQVLTSCYLRSQQWVFSQYVQNGSNDEMEILFQYLRYWVCVMLSCLIIDMG